MAEALPHLRVVELSDDLQAAYCARQFAAWGAGVVVVEPPGGHRLRRASPVAREGAERVSLLWEYVAAGKKSLVADVEDSEHARMHLVRLLASADVFLTDWKPSRLAACGLDYARLQTPNPRLVGVHLSTFGTRGPYAAFEGTDLIAQAIGGFASFNGLPGREPLKAPANIGAFVSGASAFVGAMAALRERRLSGLGQLVEAASIEALASICPFLRTEYYGAPSTRTGTTATGVDTYRTADGWVYFSLVAERAWESFVAGTGIDGAATPEELRTQESRIANVPRLKAFIAETVRDRKALDLFLTLNTLRITTGILFTPEELIDNPHLKERGHLQTLNHATLGPLVFAGPPARLSATPMAPPWPAPKVGNWRLDVGRGRPTSNLQPMSSKRQPPTSSPPLRGLRILDLTAAWIGTHATQLLGDLGADIIKVESPTRPDVWRGAEGRGRGRPPGARPEAHIWNVNGNFNSVNRNKRDLTLDLDTDKGKELFLRLAAKADLVTENYTPRVMSNFGLGYDDLRKVNEDLIMVSFSGFGATGPYADFRAIGASTEMHAGWDSMLGYPDHEMPLMLGAMFADAIAGLQMAATALVALEHRNQTGEGQNVEGAMFEAAVGYIGEELLRASAGAGTTERRANRHPDMAPHGSFPCAGEDSWLAIAVRDDADWQHLLEVAGSQDRSPVGAQRAAPLQRAEPSTGYRALNLDRPEYATIAGRLANIDALERDMASWTRDQDAHDLMRRLQAAGVPAGVILDTSQALEDEHFKATGWFIPMTHPDMGTHRQCGFPWRFSRTPPSVRVPTPRLGEHTRAILTGELGLTPAEIEGLFAEGVTAEVFERVPDEQAAG